MTDLRANLKVALTAVVAPNQDELQHLRSPVTVSDEMTERAARAIASTAYDGVYFTTRSREQYIDAEWRNHETDARTAITAALAPAEQEGESKDQMTVEQRIRLRTKFGGTSDYSKGWNDALEALIGDLSHTPGGDSRS